MKEHSDMFMFYIYVAHYNSESFSDMMYPGLNNRYEYALPMARGDSGFKENETGYFIYYSPYILEGFEEA